MESIDVKINEEQPQNPQTYEEKVADDTYYIEEEFSENEEEQEIIEPMEIKTSTTTHMN